MDQDPRDAPRPDLLDAIPGDWRGPLDEVSRGLRRAGHQAWVVGGTVRDLLRGVTPKDVDLVTDAVPDVVEGLFPRTVAVGKSFGVVIVVSHGKEIEVATFREERGYSDRRRPDEVVYTTDPGVDARRRDFTCNAIFLDPRDGRLFDPTGGARDLAAGRLRTVGDPAARFREDGLRLLRMARFLGAMGLEPAEGLLAAARAEAASLGGVSPERVLDEVLKIVGGPGAGRAFGVLEECGLARRAIPGWSHGPERVELLERLSQGPPGVLGPEGWLCAVLGAWRCSPEQALRDLRASNALRRGVLEVAERWRELARWVAEDPAEDPADELAVEELGRRVEAWREPSTARARVLDLALRAGLSAETRDRAARAYRALDARARAAPARAVELSAADLLELGVPRGPALGEGLRRVRHASLGGAFADREGALAWARGELTGA